VTLAFSTKVSRDIINGVGLYVDVTAQHSFYFTYIIYTRNASNAVRRNSALRRRAQKTAKHWTQIITRN